MRGLAIGDLHLGFEKRFGLSTSILISYLELLIEKHAIAKGIPHVFFMGDVFDSSDPSQKLQAEFYGLLHKFRNVGLTFYILAGNHCVAEGRHSLTLLKQAQKFKHIPHVKVFCEPEVQTIEDVLVNFLPWPHSKGLANALNLAHILKVGCVTETGYRIKDEAKYAKLDKHHWIIGDNHQHQIHANTHWVGTPYQTKFSESYDCKIIAFDAKSRPSLSVKYSVLDVEPPFRLETHTVKTLKQAKRLLSALQENEQLFYTLKFDLYEGQESAASLPWPSSVIEKSYVPKAALGKKPSEKEEKAASDMSEDATILAAVRDHLASKKQPPWIVSRALTTLQGLL